MKKIFLNLFIILFGVIMLSSSAYAVWRWENPQNIKVFIPQGDDKTVLMTKAFEEWQKKSQNVVAFQFVKSVEESDIDVTFVEKNLETICGNIDAMGCAKYGALNGKRHSKIYIAKRRPKGLLLSNTQVYAIMRHEIGHTLGLEHDKKPLNIMFATTNLGIAVKQNIQADDIKNLYNIYDVQYKK